MMLKRKLAKKNALRSSVKRNGGNVARGSTRLRTRTDGLHEVEDGWFICMLIFCLISWMMLFISSLLVYVHKPFREERPWRIVWGISLVATTCTTLFLMWGYVEDWIIHPFRNHLRWKAEQRRATEGKLV